MVTLGIIIRILSNSYLNVFQKILTRKDNKSSVINFYTYLGLSLLGLFLIPSVNLFDLKILPDILIMGVLGALGNYFIIKALSCGELSSLSVINSYKPVIALVFGVFVLHEIPSYYSILGIFLIIFGTYFISESKGAFNKKAVIYRILGLLFSGTEAVFIKKVILATNISTAFLFWALSGLIFAFLFVILGKHSLKKIPDIKYQLLLITSVGLMQYSTNYVFSKIDVSSALALFQLSTIVNVFLGVNIFHEKDLLRRLFASIIMVIGAIILIIIK